MTLVSGKENIIVYLCAILLPLAGIVVPGYQVFSRVPISPSPPHLSIAKTAVQWYGTPYPWGGDSKKGIDAGHLVYEVLTERGKTVPKPPVANQEMAGSVVHWKMNRIRRGDKEIVISGAAP